MAALAIAPATIAVAALAPRPSPLPSKAPRLRVQKSPLRSAIPSPHSDAELDGDTCLSTSDCWAVGNYMDRRGKEFTEALHWNGKRWKLVRTPHVGTKNSEGQSGLSGVGCATASDCWAVGSYTNNSLAELNEALHWNGKKWKLVATPQPGGTRGGNDRSGLGDVTCLSASDCWATGEYTTHHAQTFLGEALHWNGSKWSKVRLPQPAGTGESALNQPGEIACVSKSDCWIAGDAYSNSRDVNEALHWNGNTWSAVKVPQPGRKDRGDDYLSGISCLSASDCWAAGGFENQAEDLLNEVMHWNGKKWKVVPTPDPGFTGTVYGLFDIACTSRTNCWSVGTQYSSAEATLNEALHWNGEKWSVHTTPQPAGTDELGDYNVLRGIACGSASTCFAVGWTNTVTKYNQYLNQALRWNGSRWRQS